MPITPRPIYIMIPGVDYSHWQMKVSAEKLKNAGVKFGIVKAGEIAGMRSSNKAARKPYYDDQHDRNIIELKRNGIICGDYYYFHPAAGASLQARHYAEIYRKNPPNLPPIIDIEDNDGMRPTDVASQLLVFIAELTRRIGRVPWVYTRNGFWVNQVGKPKCPAEVKFWIARYGPKIGDLDPSIKHNVVMWQYTDKLKIPGCPVMDGNHWLGSFEELWNECFIEVEPELPPVAEPEPIENNSKGVVVASILNVRAGPGVGYRVLGQLYRGNEISIIAIHEERWAEFQYRNYPSAFCAIRGEQGIFVEAKA